MAKNRKHNQANAAVQNVEQPVAETVEQPVEPVVVAETADIDMSVSTDNDGTVNVELDAADSDPAKTLNDIAKTYHEVDPEVGPVAADTVDPDILTVAHVVQQLLLAPRYYVTFESGAQICFDRMFNNAIGQYVIAAVVCRGHADPVAADIAKSIGGKVITGQIRG